MANDPYSMCPCGSGKKLKFCCGDILTELQKAFRLRENQPEAAARVFRDLLKKHPEKDVLVRELSGTLFELGQTQEARQVCLDYLKAHPDQPNVLASLSEICLKEDGFDASRRLLHRTFQLCAKSNPLAVAYLAALIASMMARSGCLMSAREHLALAVRMSTGERQRNLVLQLVSFESEASLPFPFRSAYQLLPVNFNDDATQQDLRARKLSVLGCWEPAAIIYNRLADAFPTEGAVWFNLGLCQAWDGRLREAASSLHHAATLLTDFDTATDAEALAQQLDLQLSEERYSTLSVKLEVKSISELLTRLESDPTIRRHDTHDHSECHHHDGTQHVAEFVMLNSDIAGSAITEASQIPESIADIDLFDMVDEEEAAEGESAQPFLV
ncbi:MAG: tetratricopeptide repeat protein, partial [Planctomycetaceae bacterium]